MYWLARGIMTAVRGRCGGCGRYFLNFLRARPQEEDFGNNTYSSRICIIYENYMPHLPHLPHLC